MKYPIMLKLLINHVHQPPLPLMEKKIATVLTNFKDAEVLRKSAHKQNWLLLVVMVDHLMMIGYLYLIID